MSRSVDGERPDTGNDSDLRQPPWPDIEEKAFLTVKGKGGICRPEFEYEIPVADAREMWKLCKHKLVKLRFRMPFAKHVWEVDHFKGHLSGLLLAEIELTDPDEPFEKPPWIGKEVTNDKRYTNASLAKNGRPSKSTK